MSDQQQTAPKASYSMTLSFDTYLECRVALITLIREMFRYRRTKDVSLRSFFVERTREGIRAYRELTEVTR